MVSKISILTLLPLAALSTLASASQDLYDTSDNIRTLAIRSALADALADAEAHAEALAEAEPVFFLAPLVAAGAKAAAGLAAKGGIKAAAGAAAKAGAKGAARTGLEQAASGNRGKRRRAIQGDYDYGYGFELAARDPEAEAAFEEFLMESDAFWE